MLQEDLWIDDSILTYYTDSILILPDLWFDDSTLCSVLMLHSDTLLHA